MKNQMKKWIIGLLVLLVIGGGLIFAYQKFGPQNEKVTKAKKEITIVIEHGDKKTKKVTIQTDAKYLGEALQQEKLVVGTMGEYGLFITEVDGEKADDSKQQWWCITKKKEQVNTAADKTPIQNKDQFELTMKEGY